MSTFQLAPFSDQLWRSLHISRYLTKSKDPTPPERYYEQLITGAAGILIGSEYPEDFCIFRIEPNNIIWISAIYSPTNKDAFTYYQDDFFKFARQFNCITLKWCSHRTAYIKGISKIPKYKIDSITYCMPIPE